MYLAYSDSYITEKMASITKATTEFLPGQICVPVSRPIRQFNEWQTDVFSHAEHL